jgi:hypothetical protein
MELSPNIDNAPRVTSVIDELELPLRVDGVEAIVYDYEGASVTHSLHTLEIGGIPSGVEHVVVVDFTKLNRGIICTTSYLQYGEGVHVDCASEYTGYEGVVPGPEESDMFLLLCEHGHFAASPRLGHIALSIAAMNQGF